MRRKFGILRLKNEDDDSNGVNGIPGCPGAGCGRMAQGILNEVFPASHETKWDDCSADRQSAYKRFADKFIEKYEQGKRKGHS
jgi:hypothetical protein